MARPKTARQLGLMVGSPPPPERMVTLANWQDPPFNRWGFQHIRELMPTARIARGDGPVVRLPRAEHDLDGVRFKDGRRTVSVPRMLEETFTDALVVVHRGRVVAERYFNDMEPATTHLLMSVSKSLTATLAGIYVDRGLLDLEATVPDLVSEFRGTSFEGCTIQHLLDMRAGTRFDEDYTNLAADVRIYEQVAMWRPRSRRNLPPHLYAYMPMLKNKGPHGGEFDYRSVLTDVLGWVLERVGGASFAELFSREIWSKIGAAQDAEVTVDAGGCALEDGGICTTAMDLARFGQMLLRGGRTGGKQVVPKAWVRESARPSAELQAAFAGALRDPAALDLHPFPQAEYHNKWWVLDPVRRIYSGFGIYGQMLLIHEPSQTVVVKFSTWPSAWDGATARTQVLGGIAVCEALDG